MLDSPMDALPAATHESRRLGPPRRLAYGTTGHGDVIPMEIDMPGPLEPGEVLGAFASLTPCSTDKSNAWGILGHEIAADKPLILGHEACFQIAESRNPAIPEGAFMVTLGCDWFGLAGYEKFQPVLACTDPKSIPVEFCSRATYFDPVPRVKAACVFKDWFSGASLIEPVTHVLTSFLHAQLPMFARSIVVLGGGFCGQIACIIAKRLFGVRRVTMVDINTARLDFAVRNRFADEGLDARDEVALNALVNQTHGAYADVVFDALPGISSQQPDSRSLGARLLRPGGMWVMYAAAQHMLLPTITLLAKGITIKGAPYDSREISFNQRAAHMGIVHSLIRSDLIPVEVFIARRISLFDAEAVRQAVLQHGCGDEIKVEVIR